MLKKNNVHFVLALPALLAFTNAHANALADIESHGELKCAVYSDVQPFSSPDAKTRELVGMDVDLCHALAKEMGLKPTLVPTSIESRIANIVTGRADVLIANLAYTKTRGKQIQFSDPYYVAKEMLLVKKENEDKPLSYFKGKRISATKGTTSEQAIHIQGGTAVTFSDAASAFLALEQGKAMGFVTNTMTGIKMITQAKKDGIELGMVKEPMVLEPIGVGMKQNEPELLAKVNAGLKAMDDKGEIDAIWDKWIGPKTVYKMVRSEKVQPLTSLKFVALE